MVYLLLLQLIIFEFPYAEVANHSYIFILGLVENFDESKDFTFFMWILEVAIINFIVVFVDLHVLSVAIFFEAIYDQHKFIVIWFIVALNFEQVFQIDLSNCATISKVNHYLILPAFILD